MGRNRRRTKTSIRRRITIRASQNQGPNDQPPAANIAPVPVETPTRNRRKSKLVHRNVDDTPFNSIDDTRKIPLRNPEIPDLKGRRILTTDSINSIINGAVQHSRACEDCDLKLSEETSVGLASSLTFKCSCGFSFSEGTDIGQVTLPINEALVWSAHSAGTGYSTLKSIMEVMEVPMSTFRLYKKIEDETHSQFQKARLAHLIQNGREEYRLSKEAKDFVIINGKQQVCTTVQVDGGWSKRSYGHGYNAKSGVGVIIGMRSKKIIWMSTRNKGCYQCTVNLKKNKVLAHECYKNWTGSSTAMETDIITEGFKKSLDLHGLIYKRMIGDGDSSVFADVQFVYHGVQVEKIECVNHFMRNLTKKIISIKENKIDGKLAPKIPPLERKIVAAHQDKITISVRKAIEYNSNNQPETSVKTLIEDLENVLFHVFGDHKNCKPYLCKKQTSEVNDISKIIKSAFWSPMRTALNRGIVLASRLIHNCLSNDAEHFMAMCSKYISGKRVYYSHRGGYNMRMISAMFAYDDCSFWASTMYQTIHSSAPTTPWSISHIQSLRQKVLAQARPRIRAKRRLFDSKDKITVIAKDSDYGPNCRAGDIDDEIMQIETEKLFRNFQVDKASRDSIEAETKDQSQSDIWFIRRRGRITASCAKYVYKLQDSTNNTTILNMLLYASNLDFVPSIQYGKRNEENAIRKYSEVRGVTVAKSGLFVSLTNGILAASPDGLIGNDGLVEVKCPIVLDGKNPEDYYKVCGKSPFIKRDEYGDYEVVKSHQYYFQIVMTLHVTERQWCDLVVWTSGPKKFDPVTKTLTNEVPLGKCMIFSIQKSLETQQLWNSMTAKFNKFWHNDIAPEIVDSRKSRKMPFRQPDYRLSSKAIKNQKRIDRINSSDKSKTPNVTTTDPITLLDKEASSASSSTRSSIRYVPPPTLYESDSD